MPSRADLPPLGLGLALVGTYMSSFAEGFCTGYPTSTLLSWNALFERELSSGWLHTLLPIGAMFGSMFDVLCHKKFGRNKTMTLGAANAMISLIFLIVANQTMSVWAVYVGVFMMGFGCGVVSHTAPTYLHEISHHDTRGKIVSGHTAANAIGLSMSLMLGPMVGRDLMSCLSLVPFVFSAVVLEIAPASPLWLAETNASPEEVKTALYSLHGPSAYADEQFVQLTTHKVEMFSTSMKESFIRKPFIIGVGLMLMQQLSGINGFISNFYTISETHFAVVAICTTFLIISVAAVFIQDTVGRTKLLYASSIIELIGLVTLGLSWCASQFGANTVVSQPIAITGFCIFIAGYGVGYGPVPWVMLNELLPTKTKTLTTAAATSTSWFFDTIVTAVFSFLFKSIGGPVTFIIFAVFVALSMIFVKFFVPETSGLTIEELDKLFRRLYEDLFKREEDNNSRTMVINNMEGEDEVDVEPLAIPGPSNQSQNP